MFTAFLGAGLAGLLVLVFPPVFELELVAEATLESEDA